MLEDIPHHGAGRADELRKVGAEIKVQAEKELAGLYPKDPGRGDAHRLPLGAHRALRSPQLRRRDSLDALDVAVPEAQAQVGAAS